LSGIVRILGTALSVFLIGLGAPAGAAEDMGRAPLVLAALAPGPAARPAVKGKRPRPRGGPVADGEGLRCAPQAPVCIARASYLADVCRTIETAAVRHGLDPHFFARLVWKESLFDAAAVSPAGAQGIAQFMPGTAALRGLADPFNPAEALMASAAYLADLRETFGNIGLAAVAYNGGEARAGRFVARAGGLPAETRAYVQAITGHPAETWRDAPPADVDLALAREGPFQPACVALGERRGGRAFAAGPPPKPWGVILASNRDRDGAERQVARLMNRHAGVLGGEAVRYTQARWAGMPRRLHVAQVGRESRAEAEALCRRLKAAGGACVVRRN
jgi:hypothetical protein